MVSVDISNVRFWFIFCMSIIKENSYQIQIDNIYEIDTFYKEKVDDDGD